MEDFNSTDCDFYIGMLRSLTSASLAECEEILIEELSWRLTGGVERTAFSLERAALSFLVNLLAA